MLSLALPVGVCESARLHLSGVNLANAQHSYVSKP
jgi:hypothetical protein